MTRQLFSASWHRVAALQPSLLHRAVINRHVYRGQAWFILQDPASGKHHRLTALAHEFVAKMDGLRTVDELWLGVSNLSDSKIADIPTQDELLQLLAQLHAADLISCNLSPDAALLFKRYKERKNQTWKHWLLNPMSLKLPLLNPDRFLQTVSPWLGWLFGPWGVFLWLLTVVPALVMACVHWASLTHNLSDQILGADNRWLLLAVFPVIKLAHELGHGLATKTWGGRVTEAGVMLLVFVPAPYIETSAASGFRSKTKRAVVGAAGMLTELWLAALAMYLWVLVEPGLVRSMAYNVMLVAGISTLVVNGNPLLRYDAYFILCDWLEIPNLAQRGQRHLSRVWNQHVFGVRSQEPLTESLGERRWLVGYTLVSWAYRVAITLGIAFFIAGQFFFFGVLFALWSVATLILFPLLKAGRFVFKSPLLHEQRGRAYVTSAAIILVVGLLLWVIPVPYRTQTQGVIWLPEQAMLRATESGFFQRWLIPPGDRVKQGQRLLVLHDPVLEAEREVALAKVNEAKRHFQQVQFTQPAKAQLYQQQLIFETEQLTRLETKRSSLQVMSGAQGILTSAKSQDMPGQYFKRGELLGYVLDRDALVVRVVVSQNDMDLVQNHLINADLMLPGALHMVYPTRILQQVPAGVQELPSSALAATYGGGFAVDPQDQSGRKTLENIFVIEMSLPADTAPSAFGQKVFVRFHHTYEPIGKQIWRQLRHLFLRRLAV